jgi:hypothetical protein
MNAQFKPPIKSGVFLCPVILATPFTAAAILATPLTTAAILATPFTAAARLAFPAFPDRLRHPTFRMPNPFWILVLRRREK